MTLVKIQEEMTKQFRCPSCLRLLVKYDITNDIVIYEAPNLITYNDEEGQARKAQCTKCGEVSWITKEGLVKVDEKVTC